MLTVVLDSKSLSILFLQTQLFILKSKPAIFYFDYFIIFDVYYHLNYIVKNNCHLFSHFSSLPILLYIYDQLFTLLESLKSRHFCLLEKIYSLINTLNTNNDRNPQHPLVQRKQPLS